MSAITIAWQGNKKMSWPTWSLPAVKSCPGRTAQCSATCYALAAERYDEPRRSRLRNLTATRAIDFVPRMIALINGRNPSIFRIHESGDFYSLAYFRKWCEICAACPTTRFFAFTKVYRVFSEPRPDNLTLIASVYPDSPPPPAGVPTFTTVAPGTVGDGVQCIGTCDDCVLCPFAAGAIKLWTPMRGERHAD